MSVTDGSKIDVQEHGADRQTSDRRLFMQLSAFGGCLDAKPLQRALESSVVHPTVGGGEEFDRGAVLAAIHELSGLCDELCDLVAHDRLSHSRTPLSARRYCTLT